MQRLSPGRRIADPELDEALARAIWQLIAGAVESADGDAAGASAA